MHAREIMQDGLSAQGIELEIVGDAIYRFSQLQCEWMIPQHIIDRMLDQDSDRTIQYISSKLFYVVRRIEE
ncbi:hypothetical protein [Ammoniphilus sp. YIM 78166]|uniref:hypothetical protein n=1 Tax=Ammoniphilus sp. YIM 78166 TaxID=1644106 RepID=UPI00106FBC1C|nr:hypothetical protein [Ammoniphilus sp. YIM 78166]